MTVGLENPQSDADIISETINARLDSVSEIQLISIEHEGHALLEVKVKAGTLTPYYYYQDGTRTAYMRIGNESVECNSQQTSDSFGPDSKTNIRTSLDYYNLLFIICFLIVII